VIIITGAGSASTSFTLDLASRGMKTLLLDDVDRSAVYFSSGSMD